MSDIESDSEQSFASDVEEINYSAGAKKKTAAAAAAAKKTAAAAAKNKKTEEGAAGAESEDDEEDEDDDSIAADDDSAAVDDSAAEEDDDESAIDDDDEPFNDEDDDADEAAAVGRNIPARFEMNEDENEDDGENDYMEKFDEKTRKNIVQQYYPELIEISYEEATVLSQTIRDKDGFIIDNLHQTIPFITKYEKTRILGERARQLGTGAQTMIDIDETLIDPYIIASKELEQKKIPYFIKRPLPNGSFEIWSLRDLEII